MSTRQTTDDTRIESIKIGPDDPRYLTVVGKRFNKLFRASPDYVRLVSSTDEVGAAAADGGPEGRRLLVAGGRAPGRGGGVATARYGRFAVSQLSQVCIRWRLVA